MSVRTIRVYGDPVLRQRASEVDDFDAGLRRLVNDLVDTLDDADGAGLAAPQIGVGLRVFAYRVTDKDHPDRGRLSHIVNPVLVEQAPDEVEADEGCLSIPHLFYPLRRPRRVVAEGVDQHGEPVRVEGSDMLARALAHETDHLDGVLFIDRLDPDTRKRAMREIREMILAGENVVVKHSPHPGLG